MPGKHARVVNATTGVADAVSTLGRRRARTVGRTRGGGEGRIRRAGLGATSLWQRSHLLVAGATHASATHGDLRRLLRCGGARGGGEERGCPGDAKSHPWCVAGRDGERRGLARTASAEPTKRPAAGIGGETSSTQSVGGLPARLVARGGRGRRGEFDGGVGVLRNGRSRRRFDGERGGRGGYGGSRGRERRARGSR